MSNVLSDVARRFFCGLCLLCLPSIGQAQPLPATVPASRIIFADVHMISPTDGWAFGAFSGQPVIVKTTDGGRQWRNVTPRGLLDEADEWRADQRISAQDIGQFYSSVSSAYLVAPDQNEHFFIGFCTQDGGRRWRKSFIPVDEYATECANGLFLSFPKPKTGWLLAVSDPVTGSQSKVVFRTRDGGQHWQFEDRAYANKQIEGMGSHEHLVITHVPALPPSGYATGISAFNAAFCWETNVYREETNPLFHTRDGGRQWTLQAFDYPAGLANAPYTNTYPPVFSTTSPRRGLMPIDFVAGLNFYETRDGGRHWTPTTSLMGGSADSSYAIWNARCCWVWGRDNGRLYCSIDAGRTWKLLHFRRLASDAWGVTDTDFTSPKDGWALLTNFMGESGRTMLFQTHNGGRNWKKL